MSLSRRRASVAVVAVGLVLSACTGPAPVPTASGIDEAWEERGPIMLAVASGDATALRQPVESWNTGHPNERVTVIELASGDDQRAPQMAVSAAAKSGEYTVVLLDAAETAEFAAKDWLTKLPEDRFPTAGFVPSAVASVTYDGAVYAYPQALDAGLLYYRADLLSESGVKPPTTWAGLKSACAKVLLHHPLVDCYAGQLGRGTDVTSNIAEAVWSAGGEFVTSDGKADVDTSAAATGLHWLADAYSKGQIPRASLGWSEGQARQEFTKGTILFLRDWWSAGPTLGIRTQSSKVGVAPLPGRDGAGVSVLDGRNLGLSANARNKGTAAEFVRYLASTTVQKTQARAGWSAPASTEVASDPELLKQVPSLAVLNTALSTARFIPRTTDYPQFSRDVQELSLPVVRGERTAVDALAELQGRLEQLVR